MQPLRFAANAKPRLVHMFDGSARHEIAHGFGETPRAFGTGMAHTGDGRGSELHAE